MRKRSLDLHFYGIFLLSCLPEALVRKWWKRKVKIAAEIHSMTHGFFYIDY